MITHKQIDGIVRDGCPFGRSSCALADLGACSIVNQWEYDSRSHWLSSLNMQSKGMKAAAQRGNRTAAASRRLKYISVIILTLMLGCGRPEPAVKLGDNPVLWQGDIRVSGYVADFNAANECISEHFPPTNYELPNEPYWLIITQYDFLCGDVPAMGCYDVFYNVAYVSGLRPGSEAATVRHETIHWATHIGGGGGHATAPFLICDPA